MWENPKINWTTNDVIGTADLNRIEKNINHRRGYIDGFILTHLPGSYFVGISGGMINIGDKTYHTNTPTTKSIGAPWEAGPAVAGRTAGVALTANTWYHVFLLGSPLDGIVDIAFDNSPLGTNIAVDAAIIAAGYTDYRRIGSILWFDTSLFFRKWVQQGDLFIVAGTLSYAIVLNSGLQYLDLRYQMGLAETPLTLPPGVPVTAFVRVNNMSGTGLVEIYFTDLGIEFNENLYYETENTFAMFLSESRIQISIPTDAYNMQIYCNKYIDSRGKDNQVCEELIPVTTTPGA